MKSIIQKEKRCFFCGSVRNLEKHHIFGGTKNRKWSEKYGLTVDGNSDGDPVEVIYQDKALMALGAVFAVITLALLYL